MACLTTGFGIAAGSPRRLPLIVAIALLLGEWLSVCFVFVCETVLSGARRSTAALALKPDTCVGATLRREEGADLRPPSIAAAARRRRKR